MFHFSGARQTNRLDKPEWYYTQILSWAKDNHLFVGTHIQPALTLAGRTDIKIRVLLVLMIQPPIEISYICI